MNSTFTYFKILTKNTNKHMYGITDVYFLVLQNLFPQNKDIMKLNS